LPVIIVGGYLLGQLIFKVAIEKALDAPNLNQILLMFGVLLVIQNVAVILFTGDIRSTMPAYAIATASFSEFFVIYGRLVAFVVAVVLVGALLLWMTRTEYGRAIRAVSENRNAAILMGINPGKMYALSFAINSALAAAAGVIVSFLINITPFMGFPVLLKSLAIVILGGLGSIIGTVVGATILAVVETVVSYYVPEGSGWTEGVAFALIVLILMLRPRGIFGDARE
jgi:branched-chain amino acid transport system permease protein